MSFVITDPDMIGTAADELQGIGASLEATNAAAAAPTMGVLPPATDSVSARTAALLDAAAQQYQTLSAQAELFHSQFVQTLITAKNAYAETEARQRGWHAVVDVQQHRTDHGWHREPDARTSIT